MSPASSTTQETHSRNWMTTDLYLSRIPVDKNYPTLFQCRMTHVCALPGPFRSVCDGAALRAALPRPSFPHCAPCDYPHHLTLFLLQNEDVCDVHIPSWVSRQERFLHQIYVLIKSSVGYFPYTLHNVHKAWRQKGRSG